MQTQWWKAVHANLGECEQAWPKGTTFNVFYDRARFSERAEYIRRFHFPVAKWRLSGQCKLWARRASTLARKTSYRRTLLSPG